MQSTATTTKAKQSHLQRINRVMKYYLDRGANKERVNDVYKKILKNKFKGEF
jgi:ribosomal protein S3AE